MRYTDKQFRCDRVLLGVIGIIGYFCIVGALAVCGVL